MPVIPIENIGAVGVITDREPQELELNVWSSALNMRFRRNRAERAPGYKQLGTAPTVDPYWLMYWEDISGAFWFYANAASLYRTDGTTHLDVTRAVGGAYSAGTYPQWNGGILGGVPIANNPGGTDPPQSWDAGSTKFQNLPNWPASTYCKCMRPYLNYLIALDITESGTRYPTKIRWSHPADPGTVPTSWAVNDPNVDAGEYPFSETTGFVVDCLPLAGINVIYKTDSTWFMRPTGGTFIFQSGKLFRGKGILARDCVVEFDKRHFVVGVSDIWIHDGNTPQSVVEGRVKDYFFSSLDQDAYENTYVYSEPSATEIHVCFPTQGNTIPNAELIWNWTTGTWAIRELDIGMPFATSGVVNIESGSDIFDDGTTISFDEDTETFGDRNYNPTVFRVLGGEVGAGRKLHLMNTGQTYDGDSYVASLERIGIPIVGQGPSGPVVDQSSLKFCRAVYPDITMEAEDGSVDIYVGSQYMLGDSVSWSGPFPFNPRQDVKVDCTVGGRILSIRFSSSQAKFWQLAGYKLDLDVAGKF